MVTSHSNEIRAAQPRIFGALLAVAIASVLAVAGFWATRPGLAASPAVAPAPAAGAAQHAGAPNTIITPRYQNYPAPNGLGTSAGEPSIGVDWRTEQNGNGGTVMFQSYLQTLRVTFDITCATSLWEDKSAPTSVESLDPILFTDSRLGRTQVSELTGQDSLSSYTDDDGNTYTPSQGGGLPSGPDHQSIAAGPYSAILQPPHVYTDAVYYCSQGVAAAFCSRSDDGGLTFGAGVPIYTTAQCNGLHGHVKVSPHDGTAIVPNNNCGFIGPLQYAGQAAVVSTNNGTTWSVNQIVDQEHPTDPDRIVRTGNSDPSVGIGAGPVGRVYFGLQNTVTATDSLIDSPPYVATSSDNGATWHNVQRVGLEYGIRNMVFPSMVAGDDERAAFAFLGTPTGGDYQANTPPNVFTGTWHLYVARTFDSGVNWSTVDLTPNDPVQRNSICTGGTTCGQDRNLLDFMDTTVDKEGRVLVGYADGCIGACVQAGPNSFSALGTIARQTGGSRLFAAYDPVEPTVPAAPQVTATRANPTAPVVLQWNAPDSGGSPITMYNIYRSTSPGAETLLGTTTGTVYTDTAVIGTTTYYYQVAAVNTVGTGPRSCEVVAVVQIPQNPCVLPGARVIDDPTGDQVGAPMNTDLDIQTVYVAEPVQADNVNRLIFTMKVADLSTVPAARQWVIIWNSTAPSTGMSRNYVRMQSNGGGGGAVTFDYGVVVDYTRAPVSQGSADATSGFTPDGTIRIVIPNTGVGNPHAGDTLANLQGLTYAAPVPFRLEASVDSTGFGAYTLRGNAACGSQATTTPLPTQTPGGPTATLQPSSTPVPPSSTPLPTQTPGGPSATPQPSRTPLPPSSTPLPTQTSLPTQTPGGPSATPQPSRTPLPPSSTPLPSQTPGGPTATPGASTTPCTASFSDVHAADYFYTPVLYLACHGVVSGYADGTYRPYANTTRSQMVKITVLGLGVTTHTPPSGQYTFADVPPAFPFYAVIETAAYHTIISGYTCGGPGEPCDAQQRPYFRPYANVTRGQLAKLVVVAAGWTLRNPATGTFTDVAPGTAFYTFVETAACHAVISGYTCGGPGEPCDAQHRPYYRQFNPATRGQIAKIVYGAITSPNSCGAETGAP